MIIAVFASLVATLAFCSSYWWHWPTSNPATLAAINSEAHALMARYPTGLPDDDWMGLPANEWPPVIASLDPASVTVTESGVDILIKPYFDGGWGYVIPRTKTDFGGRAPCMSEPYPGVFWHDPC
ncbi:MAG: hypothetical protein AB7O49_03845 [Sphingomonadales bacterium]